MGFMDKFKAKHENSDWKIRIEGIGKLNDIQIITGMALNDPHPNVRQAAVGKLEDEDILKKIAFEDSSETVKISAVNKLKNQDTLYQIVTNEKSSDVGLAALKRINNQEILFKIIMEADTEKITYEALSSLHEESLLSELILNGHGNIDFKKTVAKKINSENILRDIIKNSPDYSIRSISMSKLSNSNEELDLESLENIDDEEFLEDIIKNDDNADIRLKAMEKISDVGLLENLAKNSKDSSIRLKAVSKLHNGSVLINIACNDPDLNVKKEAISNISNELILAEIGENTDNASLLEIIIKKINDEKLILPLLLKVRELDGTSARKSLAKINDKEIINNLAKNALSKNIRLEAINKVDDDSVLLEIFNSAESDDIKGLAFSKIKEDSLLGESNDSYLESLLNDTQYPVRLIAYLKINGLYNENFSNPEFLISTMDKINDESILEDIASNDENDHIKEAALSRIRNNEFLARTAFNDPNYKMRIKAIENPNLNDEGILANIAKSDRDYEVCKTAIDKIENLNFLLEIAKTSPDFSIRTMTLKKINGMPWNTNLKDVPTSIPEPVINGKKLSGNDENSLNTSSKSESNKNSISNETKNFTYLDNLIRDGKTEICLEHDIVLADGEEYRFLEGIEINTDNLIIDGNGHRINGRGKVRIFVNLAKNVIIHNLEIINGNRRDSVGASIGNHPSASLSLINSTLRNNIASEGGAILNHGEIKIIGCLFSKNYAVMGGTIANTKKMEIINSELAYSHANQYGGCIANLSELKINNSIIRDNIAKLDGGAINNQENTYLEILNSIFTDNQSEQGHGGTIVSIGQVQINDSEFKNNVSYGDGGGIFIHDNGLLNMDNCEFDSNKSKGHHGGALISWGDAKVHNSKFLNNEAIIGGGIDNQGPGIMELSNVDLISNKANEGGALNNLGKLSINNSSFMENISDTEGDAILNQSHIKIYNTNFDNHDCKHNLIFNLKSLTINDSYFENNTCQSIIKNNVNGDLSIFYATFNDNKAKKSVLCNEGKVCSINDTIFDNNKFESEPYGSIYNESNLSLNNPQFRNTYPNAILNKGYLEIKKLSKEKAEEFIENKGEIEYLNIKEDEESIHNFTYLDDLIKEECSKDSPEKLITLKEDINIENYELDFYEGGIVLDYDNLTIDGNGHSIDGNNKSRIFYIVGENICLKNITFKNASYLSRFEKHSNGGGAIRTIKNSSLSLIDCKFIDNYSDDDGGVILNNGEIESTNSSFLNNESKSYGGAVINNGTFTSHKDNYENNSSMIASTIYNSNLLNVDNISISEEFNSLELEKDISEETHSTSQEKNGISEFNHKSIFNNKVLNIDNLSDNEAFIFNIGTINEEKTEAITFKDLNELIESSNVIILEKDIIFNEDSDFDYKSGIKIEKDIMIDGRNHSIDLDNCHKLFDISKEASLALKNITFENGYFDCENRSSKEGSTQENEIFKDDSVIDNNGNLSIENCKFIANKLINISLIKSYEKLKIKNTVFSNISTYKNPIIKNLKNLEIYKSKFIINFSERSSLIANYNEFVLEDSEFLFNHAKTEGTSILSEENGKLEINNSDFNNNYGLNAGAVHNLNNILIRDSRFKNNYSAKNAGAIYNDLNSEGEISNCLFLNNKAQNNSGAINCYNKLKISDSKFIDNYAYNYAGVLLNNDSSTIEISNCEIKNNQSEKGGGAIGNFGDMKIIDTEFDENKCLENGGAINQQKGKLKIINNDFNSNSALNSSGAIFITHGEIKIENSRFSKNYSEKDGGAVNNQNSGFVEIVKSQFNENYCEQSGGAISNLSEIVIKDSSFDSNKSENVGGAIVSANKIEIKDSKFNKNQTKENGGAVYNHEGNMNLSNSEFNQNTARFGGALANNGRILINSSNFDNNSSTEVGGAIVNSGDFEISDSAFNSNSTNGEGGGLNHQRGSMRINNCDFNYNKSLRGGAMFLMDREKVIIEGCHYSLNIPDNIN